MLGVSGEQVRERLGEMLAEGLIRRIGAVPNHYRLGYTANGMTVWDVADERRRARRARSGRCPASATAIVAPRAADLALQPLRDGARPLARRGRGQAAQIRALLGDACRASDIPLQQRDPEETGLRLTES